MERAILAVDVCKSAAIPGKAGKYISMANGLMVESAPKIMMIKVRLWLEWGIIVAGNLEQRIMGLSRRC